MPKLSPPRAGGGSRQSLTVAANSQSTTLPSTTPQDPTQQGVGTQPLRVFAFAAGALDTTMQIGTIQALMLTGVKPDVVLGVSAGAINAVALGEVLTAGEEQGEPKNQTPQEEAKSAEQKAAAKAGRFLQLLEAYRETPIELFRALWPDYSEVHAFRPLPPLETPVQFANERRLRERSVIAKHGVISFLNALMEMRLRLSSLTRLARLALDLKASGDIRQWTKRAGRKILISLRIWAHLVWNGRTLIAAGQIIGQVLMAWVLGPLEEKRMRDLKVRGAKSAKDLLFRKNYWRWLKRALQHVLGVLLLLLSPVLAPFFWIATKVRKSLGLSQKLDDVDRVLASYALRNELGDSFALKQAFVKTFDPGYYGKFNMDYAVDTALFEKLGDRDKAQDSVATGVPKPKTLNCYAKLGNIRIVPVAANIRTLEMEGMREDVPVVDALMAATAMVPLVGAQEVIVNDQSEWYIDGANVANEPIREALRYLRQFMTDGTEAPVHVAGRDRVQIFTVSPFPLPRDVEKRDKAAPESERDPATVDSAFTELTEVAKRGLELQRFRDAELEVDLMRLFNATLPNDSGAVFSAGSVRVLRAEPHRIEADRPLGMNTRIPTAEPQDRRALVEEAIAVGCFQTMKKLIEVEPRLKPEDWDGSCTSLMAHHRKAGCALPGSRPEIGPGISEICAACRKRNGRDGGVYFTNPEVKGASAFFTFSKLGTQLYTEYPSRLVQFGFGGSSLFTSNISSVIEQYAHPEGDQHERRPKPDRTIEPLVACLFSGGVFRGVFQVGVANALQMLAIVPRVVAGASVGSITGALIAQVLAAKPDPKANAVVKTEEAKDPKAAETKAPQDPKAVARVMAMRKLGATYLALDRLVLTDRLADFVRKFTLRAGNAKFSLRDMDVVFRRLERNSTDVYFGRMRRVIAGIERVTYITPCELALLTHAARDGRWDQFGPRLTDYIQKMLGWYGVGLEVLGAEPLNLLLRELVLRAHPLPSPNGKKETYADDPEAADFRIFGKDVDLIAVTTNMRTGCMEVLKSPDVPGGKEGNPRLIEGLLASSAFPGAFRPQWSWEIFRKPGDRVVPYCDGGVLDNLPFNAVIDHLKDIEKAEGASDCPHLVFTASLEPAAEIWNGADGHDRANNVAQSWRKVSARATVMKHNKKIEDFVRAQREVQQIYTAKQRDDYRPVDVHVIAVKPKWLCGTFAFHPMLGFRRENQAASIAHGCFSTFEEFSRYLRTGVGNHERIAPASGDPWSDDAGNMQFRGRGEAIQHARRLVEDAKGILEHVPEAEATETRSNCAELIKAVSEAANGLVISVNKPRWTGEWMRETLASEASAIQILAKDDQNKKTDPEPEPETLKFNDLPVAALAVRKAAGIALREHYLRKWLKEHAATIRAFQPAWSANKAKGSKPDRLGNGFCWHLPGVPCPFAQESSVGESDVPNFPKNLSRIYELCRLESTHKQKPA